MVPMGVENDHGPTTDRVSGSKLYVPVTVNVLLPPHGVVSLQVTTPVKFRFTTSGASALTPRTPRNKQSTASLTENLAKRFKVTSIGT
jgi:hypothetical protein